MTYKVESSLWNFQAWSGGKDTLDTLKEKNDMDEVESYLDDIFFESDPTDTDINDYMWFERDAIAEHLGYKDWEAYEEGWSMEDLEDAEGWFHAIDDNEVLEKISGIKASDYDDEDDFVYAVTDWWDDLDDEKKVDIYYKNN